MNLNELPLIMIKCLLCTIILECIIGIIIGVRDKKDILNIVLVNIMTNPIVVSVPIFVMTRSNMRNRYITLYILEILTVIVEGLIYKKVFKYKKLNPFVVSIILNLGSYLLGEVINKIL